MDESRMDDDDALRHNAWKNLGIALEDRGRYGEAAKHHITAIRARRSRQLPGFSVG